MPNPPPTSPPSHLSLSPLLPNTQPKATPCQKTLKPSTSKKNTQTLALAIRDSDSSSHADSSSEESWRAESSPDSSDSEIEGARKHTKKSSVLTRKRVIRPPSYSASDEDINDAWTDKPPHIKSPLNNVLDSCQYKQKEKLPATPATGVKTRRKLFNPNKTCDEEAEEEAPAIQKRNDMDHDISNIQDDMLSFRFELPLMPKAVERLRDKEGIKTPAKTPSKKTTASKTRKNLFVTPKDVVSDETLGFLQSLDGTLRR